MILRFSSSLKYDLDDYEIKLKIICYIIICIIAKFWSVYKTFCRSKNKKLLEIYQKYFLDQATQTNQTKPKLTLIIRFERKKRKQNQLNIFNYIKNNKVRTVPRSRINPRIYCDFSCVLSKSSTVRRSEDS